MRNVVLSAALASCSLITLAVPQVAAAQASAAADEEPLNQSTSEIVVTAARDARLLKDVPMSVDVATGEELQKLNLFDVKDVQRLAPGLELTNSTGRNNTTTLRGVTFDPDQGTGPAVQVYLNEIPSDAQIAYTSIYDIQQIEVLRGPQGLLRGLSAPAGSITIATRRPNFDKVEGYFQGTGTSRSGYNVQGGVTLPFSDKVAIRVAGLVDGNRLNNVYNVTRGEQSRSRTESARITLGLRPTDNFTAYLTYQYLHADNRQNLQVVGAGNTPITQMPFQVGTQDLGGGFVVPVVIFLPTSDPRRSGPAATVEDRIAVAQGGQRFINDSHFVSLNADWDLGPATLSFAGGFQFAKLTQYRDLDVANAIVDEPAMSQLTSVPNKLWSGELRLQSNNIGDGFGGGVSAFFAKRTGTVEAFGNNTQYGAPVSYSSNLNIPLTSRATVPVNDRTISFSANAHYRSGPFRIEAGIRYSILRTIQTATIDITSPGGQALIPVGGGAYLVIPVGPAQLNQSLVGIPPALQLNESRPWTGGVNMTYELTPDITAYAAYGHSFRAGSSGVAVPVGISNDLIQSRPEKTDSFEVGFKGSAFDRRLSFSLSGFYQKYQGFLSRFDGIAYNCPDINGVCTSAGSPIDNSIDQVNGGFSFNYNGDATVKGVEAAVDARVTPNWDFGVNVSYAHGRFNNARMPCNDYLGTGVPNAPSGVPQRITGAGNVSFCTTNGRIAEIPDFNLSTSTEVRFPTAGATPFIRGLLTYRPSYYSERSGTQIESNTLINLYLGVRDENDRWELNVFAKNLLNQQRITGTSTGVVTTPTTVGEGFSSGYRSVVTTNPREFGATISHKW